MDSLGLLEGLLFAALAPPPPRAKPAPAPEPDVHGLPAIPCRFRQAAAGPPLSAAHRHEGRLRRESSW